MDLPNGKKENARLEAYTDAIRRVAEARSVGFVDLFNPTKRLYERERNPQTINGFALTDEGYENLSKILIEGLYGEVKAQEMVSREALYGVVEDKNWFWLNDYGFSMAFTCMAGVINRMEMSTIRKRSKKIRQMTKLRDGKIHEVAQGGSPDKAVDDSDAILVSDRNELHRPIEFLEVDKALDEFVMAEGYKIDLFASESEFPDLRNQYKRHSITKAGFG